MMNASDEQYNYIESILEKADIYNHRPLDFEKETESGYAFRDDAIYIDGNITFDMMALIVDYLRGGQK